MSEAGKGAPRAQILVVEDSKVFREMQEMLLGQAGYAVSAYENPQAALAAAGRQRYELVVIDYELPEMNGQQFMHALRAIQPDIAVIFVSGSLTLDLAIELSSQGVAGIFNKPANPKTLLEKINETLARHAARDTAVRIGSSSGLPGSRPAPVLFNSVEPSADSLAYPPRYVVGASDRFRELTHRLWKVRDFRAVLLLQGETGSPFELLARELAEISVFRDGPVMLCGGRKFEPRGLIEALAPSLLSHDAGTLIVTGVEEFTTEQQKTLENLITGRDVFLPFARRFRLVLAATHALADRVDEGSFGETLYYKISSLSLSVPTLREMRGDIVANARRSLASSYETGQIGAPLEIAADAAEWIEAQDWPGNHDQLAAAMLCAAKQVIGNEITLDSLAVRNRPESASRASAAISAENPVIAITTSETTSAGLRGNVESFAAAAAVAAPAAGTIRTTRPLTAKSLFRPAAASYSFTQRLADSLAACRA